MFAIKVAELRGNETRFANLISRWVLFAAIFYAMCALVRLARFNVESDEDEASHMNFSGLPSPAAAGLIISLVLFHEEFASASNFITRLSFASSPLPGIFETVSMWCLPFALILAGVLMVSRITYPHFVNQMLRSRKPFTLLPLMLFLGLFIVWTINISLLVVFIAFCFYGLIRWLIKLPGRGKHGDGN